MGNGAGKRIVVVGAGIVGASVAYHLASKGAKVIVIEAGEIASGVTGHSFAWLNTTHSGSDPIASLRGAAIAEYHRLEAELPDLNVQWTGALTYGAALPYAASLLNRDDIRRLEPNLKNPPEQASYRAEEGAVDAVQVTHALLSGAKTHGATVLTHTRVLGFISRDSTVTGLKTETGTVDADVVVLAAGTAIPGLAAMLNVTLPVDASPAIFIRYKTQPSLVNGVISNSAMEVRQRVDGTLLAAEDYLGEAFGNQPAQIALRTAKGIQSELDGVISIEPDGVFVGLRPMPVDGVPIVGFLPNINGVYVCAMHPGVTLAAIVGRLASEEISEGRVSDAFEACRPDRFCRSR
jgi:glycine/D-amino acid oxidase-like deaminating enzyme